MKIFFCAVLCFVISFSFFSVGCDVSAWGEDEIKEAVEKGLVPENLQGDYDRLITREELCQLCISVVDAWGEVDTDNLPENSSVKFDDTNSSDVIKCAQLGIVNGVCDNKFYPNAFIKRQEAARMIYNTLDKGSNVIMEKHGHVPVGVPECCVPHVFDDGADIKLWARNEITHLYRFGVMFGIDGNNFAPDGSYTRKQAICSFLRLYRCFGSLDENSLPEREYYPYGKTAANYIYDGCAYALGYPDNKDYYKVMYIDSAGRIYTQAEKGYIYPFDRKYGKFIVNVGTGVSRSVIVDRNGDVCLKNLDGGVFYQADVFGRKANVILPNESNMYNQSGGYDIESGENFCDEIFDMGEENGCFLTSLYDDGSLYMGVVDKEGNVIFEADYPFIITKCLNGIFILRNKNESYSVADTKGRILKTFDVDKNWSFEYSVGSVIIFTEERNDSIEFILYQANSGEEYGRFNFLYLNDDTGEAVGLKYNHNYYIINPDGSVKFDAGKTGYKNVEENYGLYAVFKDDGESGLFDIVGKNGKIIRKNVNKYFIVDKSGVWAYKQDDKFLFFDFFGNNMGSFDAIGDIYYNETAEREEKIIEVFDSKFINGLLWIYGETDKGSICAKYVLPDGRSFTEWEMVLN